MVSGLPNVRYLSGFTGSNALLLLSKDQAVLFTDPRYTIQASQESDCTVRIVRGSLYDAAAQAAEAQEMEANRDRAQSSDFWRVCGDTGEAWISARAFVPRPVLWRSSG